MARRTKEGVKKIMADNSHSEWIFPTLAGMVVSTLRRFRRNRNEKWRIVLVRFLTHVATCMLAGYVVGGVVEHFGYQSLLAPACALSGLFGTMLVDWIEESGIAILSTWVKNKADQ